MTTGELDALVARYGPTVFRDVDLPLGQRGLAYWLHATEQRGRRAEVVMVVQRPDDKVLLHTKAIYPAGTYRLPTGGVARSESFEDALAREQREETGTQLAVRSMPAVVRWQFHFGQQAFAFASVVFVLDAASGFWPEPQDPSEQISDFRWVSIQDLEVVAAQLHQVDYLFRGWGIWRAVPHDLLAEALATGRARGQDQCE
jgi:8-oxo-dGTP pyrophosphatase MutT (NUDIX family)